MSYLYENTSPERFQEFCQALLIDEFPGMQCFPVAQPDGGRDALHVDTNTVLQVKFRRSEDEESADWMIEALEKELPKIEKLIAGGAKSYVMVTNAKGTAHLGGGRIDLVATWLSKNVTVPAVCLWRDDLDRRFEKASPSLRFRYPELLTGQDGLELALTTLLGPQRARQMRAVRAFVGEQFSVDSTVKFKQVNLSNALADLFIDIPIRFSDQLLKTVRRRIVLDAGGPAASIISRLGPMYDEVYFSTPGNSSNYKYQTRVGAAEFLLSQVAQGSLRRIVLEGAPGQGKSTLAQFVCQVHRAAFLERTDFQDSIPPEYARNSFRLPIKVDLRDLAAFVPVGDSESASLDEFLSDLIHKESGKLAFSVDDLIDVLSQTPALLFLDGLDEVADLDQRQALVSVVERALTRYENLGIDIQVVVTSRPSVFGKRASFDEAGFVTIDLGNIDRRLVLGYSEKWVRARSLDDKESKEVIDILRDKMQLPHIVELTRNAMQLTILLSLIHQVGYSLPDQRTDLYRRYLELFLIRESEKDESVKKHATLLVEFIQYLAWILQSQAESAGSRGSISKEDLQKMAAAYLADAKQPVELANDLFGGGLERIFVLVQRVSGLYEFEVQPLREFFCARHLYETSPVGTYRYQQPKGDRAQRFEALAANPFWLNVTRFYAGSYEPGEIGSLVMSLKDLIKDGDAAVSLHGREVALALLSDWVFANKKSWQDELIEAACDEVGINLIVRQAYGDSEPLVLDEECGQATFRRVVFEYLQTKPLTIDSSAICSLLAGNGGAHLAGEFVSLVEASSARDRTLQIARMLQSGAANEVPLTDVLALIEGDGPSWSARAERLSAFVDTLARRIEADETVAQVIVKYAMDGHFARGTRSVSVLSGFVDAASQYPSGVIGISAYRDPSAGAIGGEAMASFAAPAGLAFELVSRVRGNENPHIASAYIPTWEQNSFISDQFRELFDPQPWAATLVALRAAGMPTSENVSDGADMFDDSVSLAVRGRYARLKRGSVPWWRESLERAETSTQKVFWAALVFRWTAPKVFEALTLELEQCVEDLEDEWQNRLHQAVAAMAHSSDARRDRKGYVPALKDRSNNFLAIALPAFGLTYKDLSAEAARRSSPGLTEWVERHKDAAELAKLPAREAKVVALRKWLHRVLEGQKQEWPIGSKVIEHVRSLGLPLPLAQQAVLEPDAFPRDLVVRAYDRVMRVYRSETLTSVRERQEWSFHE